MPSPDVKLWSRRDLLVQTLRASAGLAAGWTMCSPAAAETGSAPATAVLIDEDRLPCRRASDAASLLAAAWGFADRNAAEVVRMKGPVTAQGIKSRLLNLRRRPERVLIVGDAKAIPRLRVKGPWIDLETDYFYGDLDGDGLAEVAVCRAMGSPRAMIGQLAGRSGGELVGSGALFFGGDPRRNLENNRFAEALAGHGCSIRVMGEANPALLAECDVMFHSGHGDGQGLYGGPGQTYVTHENVPVLRRRPIIFSNGCSTAIPGSRLLRAFLDNGCRTYIGAASIAYGMTPAAAADELYLHFADLIREQPGQPVAELIALARFRYAQAHGLGPWLLQLERGDVSELDGSQSMMLNTAVQYHAFGDPTAKLPQLSPVEIFAKSAVFEANRVVSAGNQIVVPVDVRPSDGLPVLLLRADWDESVTAGVEIGIRQNGQVIHRIAGSKLSNYAEPADFLFGGHVHGDRFRGFALLPLFRLPGRNEVTIKVDRAAGPVEFQTESAVQIWPARKVVLPQSRRLPGINVLLLSKDEDLQFLRAALDTVPNLHLDYRKTLGDRINPFEFAGDPAARLDPTPFDVIFIDEIEQEARGYGAFPRGTAESMLRHVEAGGGLIMSGGWNTFGGLDGAGGYGGTAIAKALPVEILSANDAVNRATSAHPVGRHSILDGLDWARCPPLQGYNRVALRPGAQVLAQTDGGEPMLAVWQYGKGRVAAFLSCFARGWGWEFKKWPDHAAFWARLVRWAAAVDDTAA